MIKSYVQTEVCNPSEAAQERAAFISPFIVLIILYVSAAFGSVAIYLFPSLIDIIETTLRLAGFLMYFYCVIGLLRMYGSGRNLQFSLTEMLLTSVVLIALLSYLWSADPSLTLQRVVHLVGTTLIGVYIGLNYDARTLLNSLLLALAFLMIGGALAIALLPELGQSIYEGQLVWNGLQGEKNGFGFTAAVCVLLAICRMQAADRRSLTGYFLLTGVSLAAVAGSRSMASSAGLAVGCTVVVVDYLWRRLRIPALTSTCVLISCGLLVAALATVLSADNPADWLKVIGRSSDLTGRTEVWDAAWRLIMDDPLRGYGYGALWFPRKGFEYAQESIFGLNWTAYTAHNGFLQLASEIGLPAAVLAVAFAVLSLAKMIRLHVLRPSPFVLFVAVFQVAFLSTNLFEAGLFVDRNVYWILFVALPLAAVASYRRLGWLAVRPRCAASLAQAS